MNVIVMGGMGAVGRAISDCFAKDGNIVYILDKKDEFEPPEDRQYEFMHVAIPYGDYFIEYVKKAVQKYDPRYVIIHSTVPVGTTRKIGGYAAHSPVRGQHNNLAIGLKKFVKYVGAANEKTRAAVVGHLTRGGFTVEAWSRPEETELMKLGCLSRYLNDLAYYETMFKACRKYGVAPIRLVQWTQSYNDGYEKKWHRPELTFPMGKVGGTCVMPVSKMMSGQTGYEFFRKNIKVFDGNR